MERGRVMLSMLLFISQEERTTEGEDNGRRGQREERTAGVADSWEYNGRGQREEYEEWKRAVCTFKRASLIKRDILIEKGRQ